MKRLLLIASLVLIPAGLFLGAWQSYSYYELDREVSVLEKKQQDLIESNKRLIARIASDTSARIIETRAERELGMVWPRQDQIVKLILKPNQTVSNTGVAVQNGTQAGAAQTSAQDAGQANGQNASGGQAQDGMLQ